MKNPLELLTRFFTRKSLARKRSSVQSSVGINYFASEFLSDLGQALCARLDDLARQDVRQTDPRRQHLHPHLARARHGLGPLDERDEAMVEQLRGRIALHLSRAGEAASLLLDAGRRLESIEPELARDTHLEALYAATVAGRFGGAMKEVASAARAAPPPPGNRPAMPGQPPARPAGRSRAAA
mgnify:CR=1 FL=1